MTDLVLKHCTIISGQLDAPIQENMDIAIQDGKITSITPASGTSATGANEIDLTGKTVMPGLIDAHTHLFGTGKPMAEMGNEKLRERMIGFLHTGLGKRYEDKAVRAAVQTKLYSGVTTLRSVGDLVGADIRTRDRINRSEIVGPRMLVAGQAITCTSGHGAGSFADIEDSPWEARKLARTAIKNQVDLIKICATGGVADSRVVGEAGLMKMTAEEITAVCEEAHKARLLVASHTESTEGVERCLECGVDTIEHGAMIDEKLISGYKNSPKSLRGYSSVIVTISPALPIAVMDPEVTKLSPVAKINAKVILDRMINGGKAAIQGGVKVGLGTDASCPFVTQYDTWRELAYFVKLLGATPAQAIYYATLSNAEIMGIEKETGSVEVGKSADLLVLESSPLEDITVLAHPRNVIMRGKVIDTTQLKRIPEVDKLLDEMFATI